MNAIRIHSAASLLGAALAFLAAPAPSSADSSLPPPVLHFCAANCMTLILKNGLYIRADGDPETWTIERFSRDSVILHRHDPPAAWNAFKSDVPYAGRVSEDRLVGITVAGAAAPTMALAWGSALASVPANNAERDRHLPAQRTVSAPPEPPPVETDPLHAACPNYETRPASAPIGFDAWRKGDEKAHIQGGGLFGTNWGHDDEALAWFCKAAAAGNASAAYAIGLMLEVGYVVNKRLPSGEVKTTHFSGNRMAAYYWYEAAAKQGYPPAILTEGWFRVVGPEVLKGSTIEKDVAKGVSMIAAAADKGDTRAQLMLAYAYAPGLESRIPVTKDAATALMWANKAQARLSHYRSACTADSTIDQILGDSGADRSTVHVDIQAVRSDEEQVCSVAGNLGRESTAQSVMRMVEGGAANEAMYQLIAIPGTDQKYSSRETVDQARAENAVNLATVMNALGKGSGKK